MKKLPLILAMVFMLAVVAGCVVWYKTATTPFDETAEPLFTKENYPRVDASLAIHPLVDAIAARLMSFSRRKSPPRTRHTPHSRVWS